MSASQWPLDRARGDLQLSQIAALLEGLPVRWARVLEMRFGLNGNRTHTYEEVSAELGVAQSRVWQIQHTALKRVRRDKRRAELKAAFLGEDAR